VTFRCRREAPVPVVVGLVLVGLVAGWGAPPAAGQSLFNDGPPIENAGDFADKWLINGNAIGNAIGAVMGQSVFSLVFGPAGWVVGSIVGGVAGGLVGEWVDNKIYKSYNYAAFNRPPLGEPGSIVLENAGPMEQLLYQIDSRILIGGNITALVAHFGINLAARSMPGGRLPLDPVALAIADYLAGIIGDNVDGLMDLSAVGRRLDEARGFDPATVGPPPGLEIYVDDPLTFRELYLATLAALRNDGPTTAAEGRAKARELWERYAEARDRPPSTKR